MLKQAMLSLASVVSGVFKMSARWATFAIILGVAILPAASAAQETPEKPNILFVLADDLDKGPTDYMPRLQEQMVAAGTTFEQAFVTTPQCCPSRASILTGKYAHNHTVYDNHETLGGAQKFRAAGQDASTVATWLDAEGYETIMIGKYLNWYDGTYIPPGGTSGGPRPGRNNSHHYNINGALEHFPPGAHYNTDLFSDWASEYIRAGAGTTEPFFMYLSTNAPHSPSIPAERHEGEFSDVGATPTAFVRRS